MAAGAAAEVEHQRSGGEIQERQEGGELAGGGFLAAMGIKKGVKGAERFFIPWSGGVVSCTHRYYYLS
jgi:hypothetical protein